ncbi:hypothetical protein DFH08DRAFT_816458 [Mycena albidolilacea]|uniref:Uncharacterized protein n=1 Tax=Mycena albidolilacea TaxID=1033008 RepID=A0AAD7EJR0_9AGAR|nr:hypothetical protein DFH08DRAFT_816458 [Mycena albidolilacea]
MYLRSLVQNEYHVDSFHSSYVHGYNEPSVATFPASSSTSRPRRNIKKKPRSAGCTCIKFYEHKTLSSRELVRLEPGPYKDVVQSRTEREVESKLEQVRKAEEPQQKLCAIHSVLDLRDLAGVRTWLDLQLAQGRVSPSVAGTVTLGDSTSIRWRFGVSERLFDSRSLEEFLKSVGFAVPNFDLMLRDFIAKHFPGDCVAYEERIQLIKEEIERVNLEAECGEAAIASLDKEGVESEL